MSSSLSSWMMVALTGGSTALIFCFLLLDAGFTSESSSRFRFPFEGFLPGVISMLRIHN